MDLRQTNNRIIERLTKVLGFDVHFYSKSFFWLSLGQTSGILRGVVTTFLMARWLPRNTLGEFRYILAVFALAGMFSAGGISAGIIRGIAKGDTAIVKAGMKRILTISPFGSVILFIAALERWIVGEPIIAVAFIFAGIVFPIYSICGLYGSILTGQEKIKRLTKIAIMNNSIFAILFFVIIWRTKALLPIFITYLGFDVLIRSILTWNEIKKLPKQGSAESHIKLSDHLNAIGIVQALAAQLDQLLLHRLAGYGTLANYSIATLIPEQMKDFVNAIGGVMLRRFSTREQNQKTLTGTRKHFWTMFGLSAIMISAYALIAPIAIPLLFPQYKNEVLPSIIYATGLLGLASVVGINYFQAHHHLNALWKFYSINTTLQILTNVILIPIFGSWGAITSKTITRLAGIPFSYPRNNIKNTTDDTKASS